MRIGFIGLSTPLFYDYKNPARKVPSDLHSSPNPILDSPFGLFLLFDELWFICRSLCPDNLRDVPWVVFLDEQNLLSPLNDIDFPDLNEEVKSSPELLRRYESFHNSFSIYNETVKRVGVHWDAAADNHTHGLKIGSLQTSANSLRLENLFFDMEVIRRLGRNDVELITNSFTQRWIEDPNNPIMKIQFTEYLVIDKIPNYLSPRGPYHPCVEEARNNSYLRYFRNWISEQSAKKTERELAEAKSDVEEAIKKSQREIFLKAMDPKTQYLSIGKMLAGAAVDFVAPGLSTLASIGQEAVDFFDREKKRWQGFLVSVDQGRK